MGCGPLKGPRGGRWHRWRQRGTRGPRQVREGSVGPGGRTRDGPVVRGERGSFGVGAVPPGLAPVAPSPAALAGVAQGHSFPAWGGDSWRGRLLAGTQRPPPSLMQAGGQGRDS